MSGYCFDLPSFAYRFDLLLDIARRNAYPARMIVEDDKLWRYVDGKLLRFCLRGDSIVLTRLEPDNCICPRIPKLSRQILGLDSDLSEFYAHARRDQPLWRCIAPLLGLPLPCTETVFEALVTLIIEQHISWNNAMRSQRTLMQIFDSGVRAGGRTVYDFPRPAQLAPLDRNDLKPLKITNARIDLILRIAQDVLNGALDLEQLRQLDLSQAYAKLMSIKGIGHWTAANVIGRAFGKYPYLSHNDVALQSAVNHYFFRDAGDKGARQVTDTLGRYGDFAGLAGHFVLLRWVLDRYPISH